MSLTPRQKRWYWLLLLPLINVFALPLYNRVDPTLFGIPLFYWYQLLWVGLCSLVVAVVFRMAHSHQDPRPDPQKKSHDVKGNS